MHKSSVPMTKVPNNHVSLITQKHLNEYDLLSHKNNTIRRSRSQSKVICLQCHLQVVCPL